MSIEMTGTINQFLEGSIRNITEAHITPLTVTTNGTYLPPTGIDGYSPVTVNVQDQPPVLDSINIVMNGTYTPPVGVDGYNEITVDVPEAVLDTLSVNTNGTYTPPVGTDGYDEVIVNVPAPVLDTLSVNTNGTYTPPAGTDGYNEVNVNVPAPVLDSINITANGSYTPPVGTDGYNNINVNVPMPANAYLLNILSQPTDVLSYSDGTDLSLNDLKVDIKPFQSGSGTPSPSNIRTISGWNGCNLSVIGNNYYNTNNFEQIYAVRCTVSINSSGVISFIPSANDASFGKYTTTLNADWDSSYGALCPCKGGKQYKLLISDIRINNNYVLFWNAQKKLIAYQSGIDMNAFTAPDDAVFMTFRIGIQNVTVGETYTFTVMCLNANDSITTFVPFNGHTYNISWTNEAGTVYGGTIDILTGLLTVNYYKISLGDLSWDYNAPRFYYRFTDNMPETVLNDQSYIADAICTQYAITSRSQIVNINNAFSIHNTNNTYLTVTDSRYSDANNFQTAMANQNVEVVYELATPVTYQLSGSQIKTITGINNIFADTGNILQCEYFTK